MYNETTNLNEIAHNLILIEKAKVVLKSGTHDSLSEIRDWLWTEFRIFINIQHRPHSQTFCFDITGSYHKGEQGVLFTDRFGKYDSPEEALRKALHEILKLI